MSSIRTAASTVGGWCRYPRVPSGYCRSTDYFIHMRLRSANRAYSSNFRLLSAELAQGLQLGKDSYSYLEVTIADGSDISKEKDVSRLRFPLSYLRDNCASNFHETTLQRLTPICREVIEAKAASVELIRSRSEHENFGENHPDSLKIKWTGPRIPTAAFPDQFLSETSCFSAEWLLKHRLDPSKRPGPAEDLLGQIQPLTRADFAKQQVFDFSEVMNDDATLLQVLRLLWSKGLVLIHGVPHWCDRNSKTAQAEIQRRTLEFVSCGTAPQTSESHCVNDGEKLVVSSPAEFVERLGDFMKEFAVKRLQTRLAFPRQTNYGVRFHVKAKPNANNQAYTTQALMLHTDLPFYDRAPDIQMLNCVAVSNSQDSSGGESVFSDGNAAGLKLFEEHPEIYKLLRTRKVQFSDWDKEQRWQLHFERSVIEEAPVGLECSNGASAPTITHVHMNEGVRCHLLNSCRPEEVNQMYEALLLFQETLNHHDLRIEFKLKPGQMVIWNNNRVLHGRNGFIEGSVGGEATADGFVGTKGVDLDANTVTDILLQEQDNFRHLIGGYVDWDDVLSKMRVLEQKTP